MPLSARAAHGVTSRPWKQVMWPCGYVLGLRLRTFQSHSCLYHWFRYPGLVWVIYLILLPRNNRKWIQLHCCIVVNVTLLNTACSWIPVLFRFQPPVIGSQGGGTCGLTDMLPWREKSSCLENEGTLQIATCANPSYTFVLQFLSIGVWKHRINSASE